MSKTQVRLLRQLAELLGIKTSYRDAEGHYRKAKPESLLAALKAHGAPMAGMADVPEALRDRRQEQYRCLSEPVVVAWDGKPCHIELHLTTGQAQALIECRLELKNSDVWQWTCDLHQLPVQQTAEVEGIKYIIKKISLPTNIPWGYHQCHLHLLNSVYHIMVISAPIQAYLPPHEQLKRNWGVFLPLYALRSKNSWAAGDISDLKILLNWVQKLGGGFVGTLPLLAAFLDQPFEPSPYSPASRLFWNEFYLNILGIPELQHCPDAQNLLHSSEFQQEITALRSTHLVDYRQGIAAKRRVLDLLASCCYNNKSQRLKELQSWTLKNNIVKDYARFRAVMERQHSGWTKWPQRLQNGDIREGDYDPQDERYHLYVQWLAHQQFHALADNARKNGAGLYLDLPLGVHSDGFDVWREHASFALDVSCGAPPDGLNANGQDWDFSPLHPDMIRAQNYHYFIACLSHHLRHASILRLDHVMGLHRLFWIPRGLPARDGVYVKYRAQELYAILTLESHRHRTLLVGEDLGTVPSEVRAAMARHKIYRMYIMPFEMHRIARRGPNLPPARSLASMNTHDMPPFKTQWRKEPQHRRQGLCLYLYDKGLLPKPVINTRAVLEACLSHLAACRARIVMVNLEDLWLEDEPQNVPGTKNEYPNWRRKARYDFETFSQMPEVLHTLHSIDGLRKRRTRI